MAGNRLAALALVLFWLGLPCLAADNSAESLRLVPFPKNVSLGQGSFAHDRALVLRHPAGALASAEALMAEFARAGLPKPTLVPADGDQLLVLAEGAKVASAAVAFRDNATDEDYTLTVEPGSIVIRGKGPGGLACGAATLCQLIRANRTGASIPCLTIQDGPSIRWRAFQDDLTRGPSSTLEELKREVALGAAFKLNLFTYYMEHQFAFRKHPVIGPPGGSLLPEELAELVAYARPLHVDIMGNQQSFGHFHHILKHPEYARLQETDWVLSPVNEGTYQLLDDMYSEVIPLLPFPFFNVCCDETQGLGTGPSKELAARIGPGGVYVQHIKRVYDLVKNKHGKRMMMWGDIILNHPDKLGEIPKDTIVLTWGYEPRESFEDQILPFAKSGYEFFVCPGVNNWNRMLPNFEAATTNIRNFVRDGAKLGAIGVLNTAWDDDGETLNAPNWPAFAWGAECAWNGSTTTPEQFNRRIGAVLFGERGDRFGQAIEQLAKLFKLPGFRGGFNSRFWDLQLGQPCASIRNVRSEAEELLRTVRPAIEHLEAVRKEATVNAELLDPLIWAARRVELIGVRTLDDLAAAEGYRTAYEGPLDQAGPLLARARELLTGSANAHRRLAEELKPLWLRENRPYALDVPMSRHKQLLGRYVAVLEKLSVAEKRLAAGKPLPSPVDVGLELVELAARRSSPHRVEQSPLNPESKWRVPTASHRLGVEVKTGKTDRTDVPVEVLVRIDPGLIGQPVRAFILRESDTGELPAQLDATDTPGIGKLILMVNRKLPAESAMRIHAYLGAGDSPRQPWAVATRDADRGCHWLENNQVRLLLGPEGAHIYQWRIRSLDDRDVTMSGETSWSGFSDLGGENRSAQHNLICTASGPALVRYACTDAAGLTKTISLYAGAAWIEVTLDRPTRYYWDFDDPVNFGADGPSPGRYLFSNGQAGLVGRAADGIAAQIKSADVQWVVKYIPDQWALGMVVPELPVTMAVGPGGGYGGLGIENGPATAHFVTYAGTLTGSPPDLMRSLLQTLTFRNPPEVTLYAVQAK